jgi:hypothetical protein
MARKKGTSVCPSKPLGLNKAGQIAWGGQEPEVQVPQGAKGVSTCELGVTIRLNNQTPRYAPAPWPQRYPIATAMGCLTKFLVSFLSGIKDVFNLYPRNVIA